MRWERVEVVLVRVFVLVAKGGRHERRARRLHHRQECRPREGVATLDGREQVLLGSTDAGVELGLLLFRKPSCGAHERAG
jgi:hypothetical protein